ncbi:MAG: M56 family metallopeptidase [Vicinamibacterales bacterium]
MSFAQRFALVLLAAFFLSSVVSSLATMLPVRRALRRHARGASELRSSMLAVMRLLPAAGAFALTLLVLAPGYYTHEQRSEPEGTGLLLALSAAAGALILLSSLGRAILSIVQTARLRRAWMRSARPLDLPAAGIPAFEIDVGFPLVAVLGAVRPRLFISRSVLSACSRAELAAIVEHERSHVSWGDNLVRMAMDAAPDPLAGTAMSRGLARAWHHAIEHRADDAASKKLDLAAALVRVAKLARVSEPVTLPASALYRGEGVEARVRRLVAGAGAPVSPSWNIFAGASGALLVAAIAAAAASATVSTLAHRLLETIVSLP